MSPLVQDGARGALPPWDGESRLDFWLGHVFEVGDIHEDLLSWASRSVLMGVVLRTDHPGEKHDEMVVPGRAPWDRDVHGLGVAVAPRAAAIAVVLGRVEHDNIRLTYRRDPSPLLRRCMIVGTTNDPRCLPNDSSGNRRFLPVSCTAGDPAHTRDYLEEHREQLWAEAMYRVRTNHETAYLPDSLKGAQAELTEQYRAVDEVAEEVIGAWLDANPRAVTANQIATGMGWTPDNRSIYRITTVLKQMNYTRSKKSGEVGRAWVWTPPDGPAQLEF